MRRFVGLSAVLLCCAGSSPALAQRGSSPRELAGAGIAPEIITRGLAGSDLCADAQLIEGVGTFDFDNSSAGTDGLPHPGCLSSGQNDVLRDVWYRWKSHCTGEVTVSTCAMTAVDTKIAVYAPGAPCPPMDEFLISCVDDTCGLQTRVTFLAVAGQSYLIRLGNFAVPGGSGMGGTGAFTISCDGEFDLCTDAVACQNPAPTNARLSDGENARLADDVAVPGPGDIIGLCFRGGYGFSVDPQGSVDSFVVTYYQDNGGIPGLPIARFRQGSDLALEARRNTGELISGNTLAWEYVVCHAPVPVKRNQNLWVEVTNRNSGVGGLPWFWQVSQGGNMNSRVDITVNDSYANAFPAANDHALCLRFRTCPTDINKNGTTDFSDLNAILVNFGFDCD